MSQAEYLHNSFERRAKGSAIRQARIDRTKEARLNSLTITSVVEDSRSERNPWLSRVFLLASAVGLAGAMSFGVNRPSNVEAAGSSTSTPTSTATVTATATSTSTSKATGTSTPTSTPTSTRTLEPTPTSKATETPNPWDIIIKSRQDEAQMLAKELVDANIAAQNERTKKHIEDTRQSLSTPNATQTKEAQKTAVAQENAERMATIEADPLASAQLRAWELQKQEDAARLLKQNQNTSKRIDNILDSLNEPTATSTVTPQTSRSEGNWNIPGEAFLVTGLAAVALLALAGRDRVIAAVRRIIRRPAAPPAGGPGAPIPPGP